MRNTPAHCISVLIVGAGPYGLSVAAHLQEAAIPFRIFGRPMHTWATQMPEGMHLRSPGLASSLSGGKKSYSLAQFCAETNRPYAESTPIALEDFCAYGEEFARRYVPNLEDDYIRSIDRTGEHFRVTAASGERFFARNVIMATGLNYLQHIPEEFRHLPTSRVTHPSQHRSYTHFAGRDVTVLGSGGSALNAAVLLHEAGARVTLLARSRKLRVDQCDSIRTHPATQDSLPCPALGPNSASVAPDLYRHLPAPVRGLLSRKHSSGDRALQGRMEGFTKLLGCRIHAVEAADGGCGRLRLTLTDLQGQPRQHLTSHLIAGTGYRYDKNRLGMLSQSLREQIRVNSLGAPKLNRRFESSVTGLHFVGPLAAPSFGPNLGSIAGTQFAAGRVTEDLAKSFAREQSYAERKLRVGVIA